MNHVVLHILSRNGSLEFKQQLVDAENMSRLSSNVDHLNVVHDRLYEQLELLERESDNIAYSKHQIATMETYIDKLNHVIGLLQDRINELINYEENDDARGVKRRKSRRRKSRRRKSTKRKSRRRKY